MFKKLKYFIITSDCFHALLYRFVRLYSFTFRLTIENEDRWMDYVNKGGRVLLCAWHQQFFAAIGYFKKYEKYQPSLMISKSLDGDIIAGVAHRTGWHAVRGSSSKDGRTALTEMILRLKKFRLAGHVVDGPRGPAGIVKAGVISLARAADSMIVPFYARADNAWYFNSWDTFMLPKPFARVFIRFDAMFSGFSAADGGDFENRRRSLEQRMLPEIRVGNGRSCVHEQKP
ncbi:MAG: lysophospholipid acyltransferase family protein [Deltaproteobacteria bacterium]|nr:lysophospholipid acyltransferase family protein [Deltaproteobacteria bacterium]